MFCPACGKEIPDDSRYCLVCGKRPHATVGASKPVERQHVEKSHTMRNILLGFVALLAIYAGFMVLSNRTHAISHADAITPPAFVVKAGAINYFSFTVGGSARVVGRFVTTGGGGNDIEAVITDADDFENWKNGHAARAFYQSGKATVGNINVTLSPGTYYLAFNNRFSLLSDKTITGNIALLH